MTEGPLVGAVARGGDQAWVFCPDLLTQLIRACIKSLSRLAYSDGTNQVIIWELTVPWEEHIDCLQTGN